MGLERQHLCHRLLRDPEEQSEQGQRARAVKLHQHQPENQKNFPAEANQGITTIQANKQIDKAVAVNLPTYPENEASALALDVDFWVDNIDQLTQRFNAWAAQ